MNDKERRSSSPGAIPKTLASAKKVLNGVAVHPSDAGDLAAAQALGEEVKKYVDHLDGAFLNAGVGTFQPIEAATPKNYDDIFNVNVRGLYFQLQSLRPYLEKSPNRFARDHILSSAVCLYGC
jgi:NAD(P)-dependent dehydrogenase (short-subunit alcohol dehydrogenase family)